MPFPTQIAPPPVPGPAPGAPISPAGPAAPPAPAPTMQPGTALPVPGATGPGAPPPPANKSPDLKEYDVKLKLSASKREELGLTYKRKIEQSVSDRGLWDDRVREFRDQYEAVSYPKTWPWPNAASLNIPTTRAAVDTIHAGLLDATGGTDPLFRVESYSATLAETASKIEGILQWEMDEQIDIKTVWDEVYLNGLRDGNGIAYVAWMRDIARTRHPMIQDGEPVLVEEDDYVSNQPVVIPVDLLDFFLYPANSRTIEKAIGVGRRVWKNKNDLYKGVKNGEYDQDTIDKLVKSGADQPYRDDERKGGDTSRASAVGLENADPIDREDRPYEIFEFIWQYDADDDGIAEDCWFEVEFSTGMLLRAEQYPFWHGMRCFVSWTPIPRPGHFYGFTVPEILQDLHAEINAIRNQRVDAGTLALMPMLLKRRGIRYDQNKQRLRPGIVIECDDPTTDIKPFSFTAITQNAFAEEQKASEMAEQVTGANSYSQGASPSRGRTLGEVNQVQGGSNKRLDVMIGRLHKTNCRIAQLVMGLNRQYLSAETEYAITNDAGERVFQTITSSEIANRVKIVGHGNTLNSNKELRLQAAETLFQMMSTEPLIGEKPTRRYAVLSNYLHAMGVTNVLPFIGSEADAEALEQKQATTPPPPPPPQLSGRMDEVLTLAVMLKDGSMTDQAYAAGVQLMNQTATTPTKTPAGAALEQKLAPQPAPATNPFPPARGRASKVGGAR